MPHRTYITIVFALLSWLTTKAQSLPLPQPKVIEQCDVSQPKTKLNGLPYVNVPPMYLRVDNEEYTYAALQLGKRKNSIFLFLNILAPSTCLKKEKIVDVYFESGEMISLKNQYPLNCDGYFVRQLSHSELKKMRNDKITKILVYSFQKVYEFYLGEGGDKELKEHLKCLYYYRLTTN